MSNTKSTPDKMAFSLLAMVVTAGSAITFSHTSISIDKEIAGKNAAHSVTKGGKEIKATTISAEMAQTMVGDQYDFTYYPDMKITARKKEGYLVGCASDGVRLLIHFDNHSVDRTYVALHACSLPV